MSERKWSHRVRHMLEALEEIKSFTKDMDIENFEKSQIVQRAVERCLEIIGESSSKIPEDVKNSYPAIPWSKIKGMRNFVAHDYDKVLQVSIWSTVKNDLPDLEKELLKIKFSENE